MYRSGHNENDSKSFGRQKRPQGSNPCISANVEVNRRLYKLLVAILLILFFAFFSYVGFYIVKHLLDPESFRMWVEGHGIFGYLAYILMTSVQIIACIVPGEPFEILSGYAFGSIEGTLICLLAESVGSIIVILLTRKYGKRLVHLFFSEEKIKKFPIIKNDRKRFLLFAFLFILPGTPKDFLCYVAGLTKIPFWPMAIICSFGRIPSIVTSTVLGGTIGDKNYLFSILVFMVTIVLSCVGLLIYRKISNKNKA